MCTFLYSDVNEIHVFPCSDKLQCRLKWEQQILNRRWCFIQFISSSQVHVCLLLQVDKLLILNSSCPLSHIILPSFGFLFLSLTHFVLIGWFPKLLALICSTTLSQKLSVSNSPPQYLFLTNNTSSMVNPAPSQHGFASASYPHIYQDPLLFTPPTAADVPVAQA